jgi:CHAD domain-containing protein
MKRSVRKNPSGRSSLKLVSPAPPGPQKATPIKLLASDTVEDAAVCVFGATLDHFEANEPALRAQENAEAVHQMRVALRRLRAALNLFRDAISGPALDAARAGAKSLAATLGGARDWDVFGDMLKAGPQEALADEPSFRALLDAVEGKRKQAYRALRETLDDPQTERFSAEFRKAIAGRDWISTPEATAAGSARDFARAALTRLRAKALKKAKGLDRLTPEERHELRIALKKARYAAEFFETLFAHGKQARAFSRALADMQDGFGVFNDLEVANLRLDEIDAETGGATRASGFVRGWFAHAAQEGSAHARQSEKRLKKLEPFWE